MLYKSEDELKREEGEKKRKHEQDKLKALQRIQNNKYKSIRKDLHEKTHFRAVTHYFYTYKRIGTDNEKSNEAIREINLMHDKKYNKNTKFDSMPNSAQNSRRPS